MVEVALLALSALTLAIIALASMSAFATDTPATAAPSFQGIVEVHDVHAEADQVSAVLLNVSSKRLHGVRVRIDHAWQWTDERHPADQNPGRSTVYDVPGDIPPGGRSSFTYRPDVPLPQRGDGHFETSVSVVGLEQAG